MEYKYTGIILSKRSVGETDRIYTMYTLEGGKIRSLAKGVRKAQAKLAASLENLTLADITIVRTRGLGKITGSIVEQSFSALKQDCDALLETFLGLAIFEKMVDFENPDPEVFKLLREYLEAVNSSVIFNDVEKYVLLRLAFVTKLLVDLGLALEVSSCVSCGGSLSQDLLSFSAEHGGTLCSKCAQENPESALAVSANAVKLIRLFLKHNIAAATKIKAQARDLDSARLMLDDFLRWST
jgi:DNA repair protein RecO (recombination protein O)